MTDGLVHKNKDLGEVDAESARMALNRVVSSEGFAASPRLQQFLTYIVTEFIAGHGDQILGKSIAVEVYERKIGSEAGVSLVRVEARRLRRLLEEYYEGAGSDDEVRIVIDPGGYKPRFDRVETFAKPMLAQSEAASVLPKRIFVLAAALITVAILGGVWMGPSLRSDTTAVDGPDLERVALREHSALRLQAVNLTEQAQGMMFPVFDFERQKLAHGMFRHAISLDDTFFGSYAGASQTLVVLGIFNLDRGASAQQLKEAAALADKAVDLAPSNAWAIAAKAQSQAGLDQFLEASRNARLAFDLAPYDGHVLDLVGVTSILANDPGLAASASDPDRPRTGAGRFGSRNIWGMSQMMLGNYENAIEAFNGAAAAGAPISAPSLLFQAVAHDQLGEHDKAKSLLAEMRKTWPDFPTALIVDVIFHDGTFLKREILHLLESSHK